VVSLLGYAALSLGNYMSSACSVLTCNKRMKDVGKLNFG